MALTVEDGTGLATADAYAAVATVDTYVNEYLRDSSTWTDLTTAQKEEKIREATQTLDLLYASQFKGYRSTSTQALMWPRSGAYSDDGYAISAAEIPTALEHATAEMAFRHTVDSGPNATTGATSGILPDVTAESNVVEEEVKVGPITERKRYAGFSDAAPSYPKIERILWDLLEAPGTLVRG